MRFSRKNKLDRLHQSFCDYLTRKGSSTTKARRYALYQQYKTLPEHERPTQPCSLQLLEAEWMQFLQAQNSGSAVVPAVVPEQSADLKEVMQSLADIQSLLIEIRDCMVSAWGKGS